MTAVKGLLGSRCWARSCGGRCRWGGVGRSDLKGLVSRDQSNHSNDYQIKYTGNDAVADARVFRGGGGVCSVKRVCHPIMSRRRIILLHRLGANAGVRWRYLCPLAAVPFKRKANAVFPSLKLFGPDGLSPDANSKPPAVSPAMNTVAIPSIKTASRRRSCRLWPDSLCTSLR
jgi:hypothetical protein